MGIFPLEEFQQYDDQHDLLDGELAVKQGTYGLVVVGTGRSGAADIVKQVSGIQGAGSCRVKLDDWVVRKFLVDHCNIVFTYIVSDDIE